MPLLSSAVTACAGNAAKKHFRHQIDIDCSEGMTSIGSGKTLFRQTYQSCLDRDRYCWSTTNKGITAATVKAQSAHRCRLYSSATTSREPSATSRWKRKLRPDRT